MNTRKSTQIHSFRARNEAEIERQAIEARSRVQHKEDLRSEWEQNTNKKIFAKSVIRKVEEMKRSENVELEVSHGMRSGIVKMGISSPELCLSVHP